MKAEVTVSQVQKDLLDLKKGIDEAKINQAKLRGREEELLNQLKKDHGLSSVEEASKKVLTLEASRASIEKNIIDKYSELKEKYDW
jgi:hypothetical protein